VRYDLMVDDGEYKQQIIESITQIAARGVL
jgi:hypothetical protein